ncbi:MAG TPA: IclR family transcriptional regulator, partial [Burkholderiaceae bacterium]|nr:IclR family transcriptional regulator [Burkholderiaceae bacterium]
MQSRNARPGARDAAGGAAATHRSLERGLAVLEAVAATPGPASLANTARRLGLHRSTVHHLLQSLVSLGWLSQQETTRSYELTQKLYRLTGSRWSAEQLGEIAQPFLEELTRATGEGSSLAAWIDGAVTIVAKHEASGPVRVVQDVGGRRPIHCTAVGKALAGWLPAIELQRALASVRLDALTPRTITTRAGFEAELRRIRAAGYAVDDEEQFIGLRCVAMPVFCYSGEIVASMCVLGPKQRMTNRKMQAVREPLALQARRLSERLGAAPDLQRVIGRGDVKRARSG